MKVFIVRQNNLTMDDYQEKINKRIGELSTRYKKIQIMPCNVATSTCIYREVMLICEV